MFYIYIAKKRELLYRTNSLDRTQLPRTKGEKLKNGAMIVIMTTH